MFAVIYRGYVKPGLEKQYQISWKQVAAYFVQERGALGSTLHQAEDGMWVAYSKWPSKEARDASWPSPDSTFPPAILNAIATLKACLDDTRPLPEICMEVKDLVT